MPEAVSAGPGWEDEMVMLEAQLNASVRMQIESCREGINRLGRSHDRLASISASLDRLTGLATESEALISNYPTIKQVSRTCEHFRLIKSVFDQFSHLDETVTRTTALLEQDKEEGSMENLLLVHYYLARLEAFRHQTLALMKDAPSTVMYTLKRYFKKLDNLSADFDGFFWTIPKDFYALAIKNGQPSIVSWAKVLSRMDRGQKVRLTTLLDDWVNNKFTMATVDLPYEKDIEASLQAVSFWLGDLTTIRDGIVSCFPPEMEMMDFYALTFHRHIHQIVSRCLASGKVQPGDILFLLRWVKGYYDQMLNEIGLAPIDLEPALLNDEEEASLTRQYLDISKMKIAEWIGNLYETEKQTFTSRTNEPDVDASNYFISPAAVDLIQIIKQHITTTSESGQGKLVLEVITDTVKTVGDFQKRIGQLINEETEKFLAKPDQAIPLLEQYLIMMGNTGLRWAFSLQAEIVDTLESMVAAEYLTIATKQLKSLSDGFVTIAKQASTALCKIIFDAVNPALQQLFTGAGWYESQQASQVQTITVTFGDFFSDYKQHCEDFLMAKLVADVLEGFLLAYIGSLRSKPSKLKMALCGPLFESDFRTTLDFFSTYRDERKVQKAVDPLLKFVNLVTSSQKMVYLEFFAFWKIYPDIPFGLFEEILGKRDDLDRAAIKDILETCKKKSAAAAEEKPADIAPSIFSKIIIQPK